MPPRGFVERETQRSSRLTGALWIVVAYLTLLYLLYAAIRFGYPGHNILSSAK